MKQQTFDQGSKTNIRNQQDTHRKLIGSRPSDYSLKNLSIRNGEDPLSSIMPKNMLNQAQDGVLVMKIDLKDPERKSVVMSTTEFSQEELSNDH